MRRKDELSEMNINEPDKLIWGDVSNPNTPLKVCDPYARYSQICPLCGNIHQIRTEPDGPMPCHYGIGDEKCKGILPIDKWMPIKLYQVVFILLPNMCPAGRVQVYSSRDEANKAKESGLGSDDMVILERVVNYHELLEEIMDDDKP